MGSLMLQILLVLTVFAATSSGRRKTRPRPDIVKVGPVLPPLDPNDPNYFNPQGSVDGIHEEYIGIGDNGYEGIGYRNKYREPWYMKEWKRWDGEK
ncbi:flagellar basal body-associated protein FliL domain protein [Ancylostoma caninum]|uniref:Flagellar basal body-associated protein FliL domain protein n=1 Tax=Ancylostoma caninum TaxID=29170 RepID=A0A368GZS7_ANCCA|nr:flagellar basal body-associated protein FliL domain protein [Ancylostoma caninum]